MFGKKKNLPLYFVKNLGTIIGIVLVWRVVCARRD